MPTNLKIGALVWWKYKDGKRLLGRIVMMNSQAVTVRVLSATDEQVLESGYGVGELVHTLPSAVEMAQ